MSESGFIYNNSETTSRGGEANDNDFIEEEDEIAEIRKVIWESQYYDANTMASLSATSLAALTRLRAYKPPPFPAWHRLPLSRRAAVLILLFSDRGGDLRVVITMRASTLRRFAGHAAFPGGKAESLLETPYETARREAFEEIGLPRDDAHIPKPFVIEHLCDLPCSLARTALAVRPCVAFLRSEDSDGLSAARVEEEMIQRLDAKEVAAVFSAGFERFLSGVGRGTGQLGGRVGVAAGTRISDWYDGTWTTWHGTKWRNHNFFVPIDKQRVARPRVKTIEGEASARDLVKQEEEVETAKYRVWGMTARILVDAARIAYAAEPDFECNEHIGDEEIIQILLDMGRMEDQVPGAVELTEVDWKNSGRGLTV